MVNLLKVVGSHYNACFFRETPPTLRLDGPAVLHPRQQVLLREVASLLLRHDLGLLPNGSGLRDLSLTARAPLPFDLRDLLGEIRRNDAAEERCGRLRIGTELHEEHGVCVRLDEGIADLVVLLEALAVIRHASDGELDELLEHLEDLPAIVGLHDGLEMLLEAA